MPRLDDKRIGDPFMLHLYAALAETERRLIPERTTAALRAKRQAGQSWAIRKTFARANNWHRPCSSLSSGMDGLRLARAVRGRWPPIKIIATSGRCVVHDGDLPSGGLFLAKPYSSAQIFSALRDLTA